MDGYEEATSSHLRYAIMCRVQQRVPAFVAGLFQRDRHRLEYVQATVVQNVRHVFNDDRYRRELLNVLQIVPIQTGSLVVEERLGMSIDLSEFGPANPGEGLARRPTHDDVDLTQRLLRVGRYLAHQIRGRRLCDVPGYTVKSESFGSEVSMKIESMRPCGQWIVFDCAEYPASRKLSSQRETPTASEQIDDPWRCSILEPIELPTNVALDIVASSAGHTTCGSIDIV